MAKRRHEETTAGANVHGHKRGAAVNELDLKYTVDNHEDVYIDEATGEGSSDDGGEEASQDGGDGDDMEANEGEEEEEDDEAGTDDHSDDELGAGGSSGDEGEDDSGDDEEASSSQPSGSDADGEGDAGGRGGKPSVRLPGAKFTEGGKGSSFAKAMAKILAPGRSRHPRAASEAAAEPASAQPDAAAAQEVPAVASAGPGSLRAAAVRAVPILAESKSTLKRQAENEAEVAASKAARKERLERKQRGHVKVPKRGEDPAHDLLEKQLARVATRGVVMLFNAVSTAQHESQDALASAKNVEKLSKASFLKQLRSDGGGVAVAGGTAVQVPSTAAAAVAASRRPGPAVAATGSGAVGWKVLQDGFTGLAGGTKMKDWDKVAGEDDSEAEPEQIDGSQSSSSGDDAGAW